MIRFYYAKFHLLHTASRLMNHQAAAIPLLAAQCLSSCSLPRNMPVSKYLYQFGAFHLLVDGRLR